MPPPKKSFDVEKRGEISVGALATGLKAIGVELTPFEKRAFIEIVDSDGDGLLSLKEFLSLARWETSKQLKEATASREQPADSPRSTPPKAYESAAPFQRADSSIELDSSPSREPSPRSRSRGPSNRSARSFLDESTPPEVWRGARGQARLKGRVRTPPEVWEQARLKERVHSLPNESIPIVVNKGGSGGSPAKAVARAPSARHGSAPEMNPLRQRSELPRSASASPLEARKQRSKQRNQGTAL